MFATPADALAWLERQIARQFYHRAPIGRGAWRELARMERASIRAYLCAVRALRSAA